MPTAVITGASAGLGAEFARQLAAQGNDLVLVARDAARLQTAQVAMAEHFGVNAEIITADLTTDAGCDAVAARLSDPQRPVDTLVNNAGLGLYQRFGAAELADEQRQLDLNVRAVLRLSHAAVRAMTPRNSGQIINVASVAAFVPRADNATYGASKAWVVAFTEALAVQLAGTGVRATAICPGFTHTEFHQRAQADMSGVPQRLWLDAEAVVAEGLADAARGKPVSVPSRTYKTLLTAARAVPRPLLRTIMARRGL